MPSSFRRTNPRLPRQRLEVWQRDDDRLSLGQGGDRRGLRVLGLRLLHEVFEVQDQHQIPRVSLWLFIYEKQSMSDLNNILSEVLNL